MQRKICSLRTAVFTYSSAFQFTIVIQKFGSVATSWDRRERLQRFVGHQNSTA